MPLAGHWENRLAAAAVPALGLPQATAVLACASRLIVLGVA
jgi:hypothetical protein